MPCENWVVLLAQTVKMDEWMDGPDPMRTIGLCSTCNNFNHDRIRHIAHYDKEEQ